MNHINYFKKSVFVAILTCFCAVFALAQPAKTSTFRQDTLLNGFKVLVWSDPAAEKVTIKLRIHSGAAFDPKDKMGVMSLLSEILFPTDQARAFFTEDLDGSLEITSNYDYIQINATGKSTEVLAMLETISKAVVDPEITPDTFKPIAAAHLKRIEEQRRNPAYFADLAVAKRFFGDYPYGRTPIGTADSIARIDHADLLFAKQRFLTSDNATLAIIGNVKYDFALRAVRQLFGGWVKADKKVPATFTMPGEPNAAPQVIDFTTVENNTAGSNEIRFASRGLARKDPDYFAMRFLADILQNRFRAKIVSNPDVQAYVVHERTLLPGLITFKFSVKPGTAKFEPAPLAWIKEPVTTAEFDQTRAKVLADIEQKSMADKMLDIDTFRLSSAADEMRKLNSVTLADVQRVADKIAGQPFVQISLNNAIAGKP